MEQLQTKYIFKEVKKKNQNTNSLQPEVESAKIQYN